MGVVLYVIFMIFIVIRIVKKTQKDASGLNKPKNLATNIKMDFQSAANNTSPAVNSHPENNGGNVIKPQTPPVRTSGVNKDLRGGTHGSSQVVNSKNRTTLSSLSALMENRGNDWLARQLAEERAAKKRMSDMFDLKQQHVANCDAEHNRMAHYNNCDAGSIDRARGR